jgi:biotin carboxyl carrier protein
MKYQVTLDGELQVLELLERGDRLVVVDSDGAEFFVDLAPVSPSGSYALLVDLASLPVAANGTNDDLVLHIGSETWHAVVLDAREAAARAAESARTRRKGGGRLRSVMPGIVRELRVREGDAVVAGQTLLILEAMKMQNEIRADADGTVASVHVTAGNAVAKGDALVTLA